MVSCRYALHVGSLSSDQVRPRSIALEGNYNGTPTAPVLPLDALEASFGKSRIAYAQGSAFAEGTGVPVPRSAFVGGVTASFFNGTTSSGPVVATRRYAELDHNWNWVAPAPGVDPKNFSVRWSATIKVPAAGDYRFELQRRRCDATADVERYTIRIEGAEPLKVEAPCSARDAGDPPQSHCISDSTRPRRLTVEYAHRSRRFCAGNHLRLARAGAGDARRSRRRRASLRCGPRLRRAQRLARRGGDAGADPRLCRRRPHGHRASGAAAALLAALEATGKPVVIVLQSGSAVPLGAEGAKARAIVQAWYGGEQGGRAIADVLDRRLQPGWPPADHRLSWNRPAPALQPIMP